MSDDTIDKIKAELFRLHARPEDVGDDGIIVSDVGHGDAVLQCQLGRDFQWSGPKQVILERLSGLPEAEGKNGPELVRSEFA